MFIKYKGLKLISCMLELKLSIMDFTNLKPKYYRIRIDKKVGTG